MVVARSNTTIWLECILEVFANLCSFWQYTLLSGANSKRSVLTERSVFSKCTRECLHRVLKIFVGVKFGSWSKSKQNVTWRFSIPLRLNLMGPLRLNLRISLNLVEVDPIKRQNEMGRGVLFVKFIANLSLAKKENVNQQLTILRAKREEVQ